MNQLLDLDPGMVRCPYGEYARLRDEEPVRWAEELQAYLVTRHADIVDILRAPETFSSAMASGPGSVTPLAKKLIDDPEASDELKEHARRRIDISKSAVLLFADPPDHLRQRKLVNKAFTARRVREMEPAIERISHELIDEFAKDGRVEMVRQFSIGLPTTVIADVLGVPAELHETFKRWSDAFVAGTGNLKLGNDEVAEIFASVNEFYDYFNEQIADRAAAPQDDLLTAIVQARIDGEQALTHNEMLQMLVQFLVAGNETTTNLLTSVMFKLVTDQELMAEVRGDPERLGKLVEEVLRMESPVQGLFRTANEDTEVGDVAIAKGSNLFLMYGAANRDERAFSDPGVTKLDRSGEGNHLAFGQGEHFCLGAPIARTEARLGISALLERLTDIRLDCAAENVEYLPSFAQHGIARLPLTFSNR